MRQSLTRTSKGRLGLDVQSCSTFVAKRLRACKPSWSPLPPMLTARQQMSACTFEASASGLFFSFSARDRTLNQDGLVIVGGKGITSEAGMDL